MKKIVLSLLLIAAVFSTMAGFAEEDASDWHNVLLLGEDSRSYDGEGRTDTIIVLSINRDEGLLKMTSIMRDIWVEFPGIGKSHKINAANVYGGPELAVETVNHYFGTDIENYVLISMDDLEELIDMIGGIDIEITSNERNYINEHVSGSRISNSGIVHLNGEQTVLYVRIRYIDSDYVRVMRQQKVLLALADKLQNMDVDELMELADDFISIIDTNMDNEMLKELATIGLIIDVEAVEQFRIPADNTFESGLFNGTWMIRPDFDENRELLEEFIYGE